MKQIYISLKYYQFAVLPCFQYLAVQYKKETVEPPGPVHAGLNSPIDSNYEPGANPCDNIFQISSDFRFLFCLKNKQARFSLICLDNDCFMPFLQNKNQNLHIAWNNPDCEMETKLSAKTSLKSLSDFCCFQVETRTN